MTKVKGMTGSVGGKDGGTGRERAAERGPGERGPGERGDVTSDDDGAELVRELRRWHDAGAVWRVAHRDGRRVAVSLLRCDGGEEVGRLVSDSPVWLDFLRGRESSDD